MATDTQLRFDRKVALVTGGSRGLGRAYALQFARLGARVVINSLGCPDEDQPDKTAAQVALEQIEETGGEGAILDCPVLEADRIVNFCKTTFGGLDVVVHNAGVVRDRRLANLVDEDWYEVTGTSLDAAFALARAAWPLFVEQGGGRLLFAGSSSGLYGNFGQANYSAAKGGLVGLANTIALEGAKYGIHANVVAPVAATRMNRGILPETGVMRLTADRVAPVVAWLCHADCKDNGSVYEVAGGWVGRVRWERSTGVKLSSENYGIEDVARQWEAASDFSRTSHPASVMESMQEILDRIAGEGDHNA